MNRQRETQEAFTLVEVLLAVVLLGIGSVVIMTAASRCLAVARASRNYYQARHVLDLGELEYPVFLFDERGKEKVENVPLDPVPYPGGFFFSRTAEPSERFEGLHVVRTRVTWQAGGRERIEEVVGYLYYTNAL